jgi:secondary thiamine-phosphate synthase enzyme
MKCESRVVNVSTKGRGLYDITSEVRAFVREAGVTSGLCNVFVRHTSASLVIQENADPAVLRDLERWLAKLAPEDSSAYEHDDEGPDDMPAHLRSAVTKTSETVPIADAALLLGTWQAIYLWEHRQAAHTRSLVLTAMGTGVPAVSSTEGRNG